MILLLGFILNEACSFSPFQLKQRELWWNQGETKILSILSIKGHFDIESLFAENFVK